MHAINILWTSVKGPIGGLFCLGILFSPLMSSAVLVDTDNNTATNETYLGDIDTAKGTLGDLSTYISTDAVHTAGIYTDNATNDLAREIKLWTTNATIIGYTEWTFSGDTSPTANYTINMTEGESSGTYDFSLNDTVSSSTIGTITTNVLNPTLLEYPYDGGTKTIMASRNPIRRNNNGFAYYSDVQELANTVSRDLTNAVASIEEGIESMDTSYLRYNYITNKNQSVQYWAPDATVTNIDIQIPEFGMTKDWIVYIFPATNVTITLPPLSPTNEANYWMTSLSVTNDIPAGKPTALYFSQINEDTFSMGRKEFGDLVTIWTPGQREAINTVLARQNKSKRRSAPVDVPRTSAIPTVKPVSKTETNKTATATTIK